MLALAANLIITRSADDHIVSGPQEAPQAQVAIVLGARVYKSGAPSPMLRYVIEQGVLDKDVFTDYAGFSTYDTMYRAGEVFMVTDALVVTQGFHLAHPVHPMWTQDLGISCLLQAGQSLQ